ncbi:MAG TPA: glycoside hydrolase family 9 protein [Gemmatimonadaceae bacterium]|nr:glycoside hydrolase family 9 protein [Gemmatimonadaceae bacterium]
MPRPLLLLALASLPLPLAVAAQTGGATAGGVVAPRIVIRVNQLGYLPDAPKSAVACALDSVVVGTFTVQDEAGRVVAGPSSATASGPFGPCAATFRLDFSGLRREGRYRVVALADGERITSPAIRVDRRAYAGAADTLLYYLRQQRSGWNPLFRDSVHVHDGIVVDDPVRAGDTVRVSGGWADASDYLQYVTTSATATHALLAAWRDHPRAFGDAFQANGTPGANGVPDVLDEARHGLDWLLRMFPGDAMYNQLGDDRDHSFLDLPTTDSSDYGWGKGGARPVYPCTGQPQGLFAYRNRSTGLASTAGKYASTFALAAELFAKGEPDAAAVLRGKAIGAYARGRRQPGVCQTAPGVAPYFYEEENWVDDMELAAAQLHALTSDPRYLVDAEEYAAREPVTPWMGADTARHYEWFPWVNLGHYAAWRTAPDDRDGRALRRAMAERYRQGLERVVARAGNGFRVGIPFIWCSNDLMTAFATQALLYRRMTGDERFREYEAAAVDWLFGTNPWGVSMVIGLPSGGSWPRDPHSVVAHQLGVQTLTGGLVDGPVYRSIYLNLKGIALREADEYAPFNTGFIVYHDDFGDYSTNEPILDGTASLVYLLSALAPD